jgi:hypothetical protein
MASFKNTTAIDTFEYCDPISRIASSWSIKMPYNVFGLGEGGDFHHKCVCGAMNRHFCQTRVIGRFI